MTIDPAIVAAPIRTRPDAVMKKPATITRIPPTMASDAAPSPAADDLARLLAEPAAR